MPALAHRVRRATALGLAALAGLSACGQAYQDPGATPNPCTLALVTARGRTDDPAPVPEIGQIARETTRATQPRPGIRPEPKALARTSSRAERDG
jgi:hypothetical protein